MVVIIFSNVWINLLINFYLLNLARLLQTDNPVGRRETIFDFSIAQDVHAGGFSKYGYMINLKHLLLDMAGEIDPLVIFQ